MKSEELLRHIGSVDDRFIDELFEESSVVSIKRASRLKGWRTLAASLAVVIAGTAAMFAGIGGTDSGIAEIGQHIMQLPMASNTVIMLDVNPSMKLQINDRNVVVEVDPLNKDAEKIAADIDIIGKKYDTAVKVTVNTMQEKGYISNLKNSVLVSVLDKDEERADKIRGAVVDAICKVDKQVGYDISVISQTMTSEKNLKDLAESNNVSTGRILLLSKICKERSDLSFDALVKNNIHTINQFMAYMGAPEDVELVGAVAGVVPEKFRDKVNLDDLSTEEVVKFTKAMSDFYNKLAEYYSESDVAKQIGYVLNIAEGKNASGEKLWGIIAESRNQLVGSKGAIINVGDDSVSTWVDQKNIGKIAQYISGVIKKAA